MGSSAQSDASGGGGSQYAGRSNSLAMMLSAQLSDLLDERLSKLDHIRRCCRSISVHALHPAHELH